MKLALDNSALSQGMRLYRGASIDVLFNTGQEMLLASAEVKNKILHIIVIIE